MNAESGPFREMTVADLIARLAEMPEHRPVTVMVDQTAGVIIDVWQQSLSPGTGDAPHVLIGERITPPDTSHSLSTTLGGGRGRCACGQWFTGRTLTDTREQHRAHVSALTTEPTP